MKFCLLSFDAVDWASLDTFDDRLVFQTREWLTFLTESQHAVPVIASLLDAGQIVGYFTGFLLKRMGIRILASPLPGWTTQYMGFNLLPHVSRSDALRALETFAFKDLKCLHIEVTDRFSSPEEGERLGFSCELRHTLVTDISPPEDDIFKTLNHSVRGAIRKAQKSGVTIEHARDEKFANEYYTQLQQVFARQSLVPTYSLERVKQLIRYMLPGENVLFLRALDPQGACIATSIYVGVNKIAVYWGNASFRDSLHWRPNELMNWHAIRYWKERGIQAFDWGGEADYGRYKRKYGGNPLAYPSFRKSRYQLVGALRNGAMNFHKWDQRLLGWFHKPNNSGAKAAHPTVQPLDQGEVAG
ncbi:MAG TPA: GNAT family N-acetyltransferase [Bryobacteraceae bacterium]|jgi:hypothetical protein|nr:GNAT family N-acetyltransferase [Bryobacteraceae bacterium]